MLDQSDDTTDRVSSLPQKFEQQKKNLTTMTLEEEVASHWKSHMFILCG
jgi:hypothetical protein